MFNHTESSMVLRKQREWQGLREQVGRHVGRGHPGRGEGPIRDMLTDEMVTNVDVFGARGYSQGFG